jgi:hypothetical protein
VKKLLVILLFAEPLLAAALGRVGHLDQPAALEWNQHPTVETRRAFEQEKQIEEAVRLLFSGGVFMALASVTIFVYWLMRGDPLMLILKRWHHTAKIPQSVPARICSRPHRRLVRSPAPEFLAVLPGAVPGLRLWLVLPSHWLGRLT